VLLPLVLPCAAHGDEGPHDRRAARHLMRALRHIRALALAALAAGACVPAFAAEIRVAPGEPLQEAVSAAAEGDVIRLAPGVHRGSVVIDRILTLEGEPGAVIEGPGEGSVIRVSAPGTVVRGLT